MASNLRWAAEISAELLSPLGRRWTHVQAVASLAHEISDSLFSSADAAELFVAAAYLHDVGYAPAIAVTGFHPLDGARFVRDSGWPEAAELVAHHTGARNEALLRGIDLVDEFEFKNSLLYRALTFCDLTTGPEGARTSVDDRVEEIGRRYGDAHVASRAILMGVPEFKAIESEVGKLIRVNGSRVSLRTGNP
jgi:HD domain